jgi:DNA-binding winged helix-turn-helix (wHTH) protein/predicted negative regulator of RcsB-dependent stress response
MSFTFGRFQLDEQARTLSLDGVEQQLQPLVFDLLVYLVRHRERVVPKDELLTKLWDGTSVTEGSLQRAVSLLRGVLREGGQEQAVQTHARRGYRFQGEDARHAPEAPARRETDGRALFEAAQFELALQAFAALSDHSSLGAADWEAWGNAALCTGRPELAVMPMERAVAAYEQGRQPVRAANVAVMLGNVKLEARELAIAQGWLQRARAFLRHEPEGREHALADWLTSRIALFEGRLEDCRERAQAAQQIADRVEDPDLHALGLIYQGHIHVALGEVRRGLVMHDEAGAMALAGRISPWVAGIVFCSVIWVYLNIGDHHRAGQWTDEFQRWCESHVSYSYPALCRLHRSEVLAVRGELERAEAEVCLAREQLAVCGPYAEGDACRVLGEIQLAKGDLDAAERAFREAYRLGWNPQPGLSLLFAERGDHESAVKQLERALSQPSWTDGQRRGCILAVLARLCIKNGQLERARSALEELSAAPVLFATLASAAERSHSLGELAWAEGRNDDAERELRASLKNWIDVQAPLQAAQVRLRLCELLQASGDPLGAELELSAAEGAYQLVNATPLLERCAMLRARAS